MYVRNAKDQPESVSGQRGESKHECAKSVKQMSRLKQKFIKEVAPALKKEFGYANLIQVPKIEKVVVNSGIGRIVRDEKMTEWVEKGLTQITGQKAVKTKAKKSIASFKIRQGMDIGVKVTLRNIRMYDFLDRLISIAFPRTRDFHGIDRRNIDQHGNLTFGIKESVVFPESSHEKIGHIFGFEATVVTTAKNKEEAERLFELLGFPLKK